MKLKCVAYLSVVALLLCQMLLVEGNKETEGKREKDGTGKQRQKGAAKEGKQARTSPDNKDSKSKGQKGSLQGKFVSKEKADCIWSVTGTETVHLNVQCTKGESTFSCTFAGNPSSCPKYAENQKSYWKQIARALRKQKNICQDPKAVLKSKDCKKGPQEAHMRYIISSMIVPEDKGNSQRDVNPPKPGTVTEAKKECLEDEDTAEKKRIAEEYCGSSWSSLCNFFLSMVQSKSC
ncbi:fibroblast growth factor-binding protein 1 [Spea bombifrons]|uniref:fibroblast growth factor-binding protein 1 n=1 Tax=Spea bombifrons TaxID=233779 RepID=UPI00234B710D|nr:fibroblast growth factor-binding protein 1 [Spea bombifrons]